jgi:hypothetical protein
MNFSEYTNYDDFCKKTGLYGVDAINFLLKELQKIQEKSGL